MRKALDLTLKKRPPWRWLQQLKLPINPTYPSIVMLLFLLTVLKLQIRNRNRIIDQYRGEVKQLTRREGAKRASLKGIARLPYHRMIIAPCSSIITFHRTRYLSVLPTSLPNLSFQESLKRSNKTRENLWL